MKKLLWLLITAVIIAACNDRKERTVTENPNQQIVEKYFKHFNDHEWTKLATMYAATSDFKDPSLGDGIVRQTRQQTADKYLKLNEVFPDLHDEIIRIYPSGSKHIIVEFVSTGTAPDHSEFTLPICTIFTIENGLITKDFSYFDNFDESHGEQ